MDEQAAGPEQPDDTELEQFERDNPPDPDTEGTEGLDA